MRIQTSEPLGSTSGQHAGVFVWQGIPSTGKLVNVHIADAMNQFPGSSRDEAIKGYAKAKFYIMQQEQQAYGGSFTGYD